MKHEHVYIDSPGRPPEEVPEPPSTTPANKVIAAREASRLAYRESKATCATCRDSGHVARFYRCRWCGLYYCTVHAHAHFQPSASEMGHVLDVLSEVDEALEHVEGFDNLVRAVAAYLDNERERSREAKEGTS